MDLTGDAPGTRYYLFVQQLLIQKRGEFSLLTARSDLVLWMRTGSHKGRKSFLRGELFPDTKVGGAQDVD